MLRAARRANNREQGQIQLVGGRLRRQWAAAGNSQGARKTTDSTTTPMRSFVNRRFADVIATAADADAAKLLFYLSIITRWNDNSKALLHPRATSCWRAQEAGPVLNSCERVCVRQAGSKQEFFRSSCCLWLLPLLLLLLLL